MIPPTTINLASSPAATMEDKALRDVSIKLEASFLSEMLKAAGLGDARESFGGGAGEEQFGSFLRQAQAERIAQTGGIGLAESIYNSLKARADG